MAITVRKITKEKQSANTFAEVKEMVLAAAAEASAENIIDVDATLGQGEYVLDAPVEFSAEENPNLAFVNLTLRPESGMRPVIHSLVRIDNRAFKPVEGKPYFVYQFPKGEDGKYPVFRELYDGKGMLAMAQSKVFVHPFGFADRPNRKNPENHKGLYLPEDLVRTLASEDLSGSELTMRVEWEFDTLRVTGVDFKDTKEHDGKKYVLVKFNPDEFTDFVLSTNGCLDIGGREAYFANSPAFLTEPNTYTYDCVTGKLYYLPAEGMKCEWINFRYPVLENMLIFRGLNNLTIEGLTFTGVTSKFICERGYSCGQANWERRVGGKLQHSAVTTYNVRNFTLRGCVFRDIGCNGLLMTDRSVKVHIYDNRFTNIGMTALSIGNPTTAWEDPKNQNIDINVVNNYFYNIGYEYPASVAFYMGMVDGLRLCHNTMDRTAYSAVSVGWGWSPVGFELGEKVNVRDADISYNRITNFMDILRDGAAIYVLGANCTSDLGGQFNFMHDNFAYREVKGDGSKRGYYMDGSASNWECYNNVIGGTGLPLFSQFHVSSQFTHHNYLHDIYSADKIDEGNHAPWRDTILGEYYEVLDDIDLLCETYPEAAAIRDAAGCDLDF